MTRHDAKEKSLITDLLSYPMMTVDSHLNAALGNGEPWTFCSIYFDDCSDDLQINNLGPSIYCLSSLFNSITRQIHGNILI